MINILATIGPQSEKTENLREFAKKTKLFRLNGSHNNLEWHEKTIKKIRKLCPDAFILLDVPGVKPRTQNIESIEIKASMEVLFGEKPKNDKTFNIRLTKPLPRYSKSLKTFSINDGQFYFDVLKHNKNYIIGKSRSSFTLLPKKGINLPDSLYDEKKQLEIYFEFIKKISKFDINGLGLSFVQTPGLVTSVKKIVPELILVSKIENSKGLDNCEKIINVSDAIMIDRGDLAAEIRISNLYNAIEHISASTKSVGKPLIMATENLESMINREVPSKSDIMSIVHSLSIGTDCIMLSEETATAKNGMQILYWLSSFLSNLKPVEIKKIESKSSRKFHEMWRLVEKIDEIPVLIMTRSGYALFDYVSIKIKSPIILVTSNPKLINIAKLFSNSIKVIDTPVRNYTPIEMIWGVINKHKNTIFEKNHKLAAIFVSKYVKGARANCITFFDKKDFW